MDFTQEPRDNDDVIKEFQDKETDARIEYDESTKDDEDDVAKKKKTDIETEIKDKALKEERKDVKAESEIFDEIDILTSFVMEFEAKRRKELVTKAEEEKKQLRHLIRIERKKDDDASEETLITPEDEEVVSDRASTESSVHPCLREIEISDSQMKLVNPYTMYRVPNDPGLLPAFSQLRERPPIYDVNDVQKFYDIVKRMGSRPIGPVKDMLTTDYLNLRYYGFRSPVMKALCDTLANNTFVQKLDLKDNKLTPYSCKYLNDLLLVNNTITDLSLSGCRIGVRGAKKLYDAISENTTLKTLDLSRCNLGNEGFEHIASALSINQNLESVNLTDNCLEKICSKNVRDLLTYSCLTHLNLSWNSLYDVDTWKGLVDGFNKNETLRSLNLSWNALDKQCLPHLCKLLSSSKNIEKLDLSWNRFTESDAGIIAKALSKNSSLQELYLGNNPLKAEGASDLIHALTPKLSPNSVLRLLDLENVWAKKDVLPNLETIKMLKPWLTINLGGILSNYPVVEPNVKRILLKRANYEAMLPKKKKQRRNFGHFIMSLTDKNISRANFMQLVKKFGLKLSASLIDEIMNAFTGPKNTVDQKQLKLFYLEEYPETTAKPLKLKKKN